MHYGITKNYIYLYGLKEFEVVSDHLPLLPLYNNFKDEMPVRVRHHRTLVQGYSYRVIHQKGGETFPSDYLSRHPVKCSWTEEDAESNSWDIDIDMVIKYSLPNAITLEEMKEAHAQSPLMQ